MTGDSRYKLVRDGYTIYRRREAYAVNRPDVTYEIREHSSRGHWVLTGVYPTKGARDRALKDLLKAEKALED